MLKKLLEKLFERKDKKTNQSSFYVQSYTEEVNNTKATPAAKKTTAKPKVEATPAAKKTTCKT